MNLRTLAWKPAQPRLMIAAGLFGLAWAVLELLDAKLYDGDGLKSLPWNVEGPSVTSVNHLLSPLWNWSWWQIVGGWSGSGFDQQMDWLIRRNRLAGAMCVALVADLVWYRTRSGVAAGVVGMLLLFCSAFFYHASQPTEPMLALFWLLWAWWLLATTEDTANTPRIAGSAICFALSVASYQSYLFGAGGFLVVLGRNTKTVLTWCVVALAGGLILFIGGAIAVGAESASGIWHYLTLVSAADAFLQPSFERVGVLGFGFSNSIWPIFPEGWVGFRRGWSGMVLPAKLELVGKTVTVSLLAAAVIWSRLRSSQRNQRYDALLIFGVGLAPLVMWYPHYWKLWLMPLAALMVMVGEVIAGRKLFAWIGLLGAISVFLANLHPLYLKAHQLDNPQRRTTELIEESAGPRDLLVCDGWDHTVRYLAKNPQRPVYPIIMESDDPERLARKIRLTQAAGHRVFFFNVLERSREQWEYSFGQWPVLHYTHCEPYRRTARRVWRGADHGIQGDLYDLPPGWDSASAAASSR